jgi:hypothetical protein
MIRAGHPRLLRAIGTRGCRSTDIETHLKCSNALANKAMAKPKPNFIRLDTNLPDVAVVVAAMLQAREAVEHHHWSSSHEPATEFWWADVLADPRAEPASSRAASMVTAGSSWPSEPITRLQTNPAR